LKGASSSIGTEMQRIVIINGKAKSTLTNELNTFSFNMRPQSVKIIVHQRDINAMVKSRGSDFLN
jgi:ABC-type uncharacterized transport system ATPase component